MNASTPFLRALLVGAFVASVCAATDPVTPSAAWTATGLNERIWRNVVQECDATGREIAITNSYIELATGLCWWNPDTCSFEETEEAFEIAPDGTAVAVKGQHKVFIKANLNEGGAVDMFLPDGQRFRSNPMGLSYFDAHSGKNVLLGEIKDCRGEQIAPNVIWFPDAFDTVKAGIRFTYAKDSFEQDVILWENPGPPEEYGLDRRTTTLECYTELYDIQEPEALRMPTIRPGEEEDPVLDFGSIRMERGRAYFLGDQMEQVAVKKTYAVINGSRRFLIEHVPYEEVAPGLERLQARATKMDAGTVAKRSFPSRRELAASVQSRSEGVHLAGIQRSQTALPPGLVIDYYTTLTSTISNYVFTNACTYYVSGPVTVSGSLTVEPLCVVKYASGASIDCGTAALTFKTEPYCMAILTAKDDNTVGAQVEGSTGNPSGYYANPALRITAAGRKLQHLRVSHAQQGVLFDSYSAGGSNVVSHAQFVHCYTPLQFNGYYAGGTTWQTFYGRNILITNAYTAFKGYSFNGTIEHLTANGCTYLAYDYNGQTYGTTSSLSLKNTLLCGIGADYLSRPVSINRNIPYTQTVTSGAFAGVGAGGHYLSGSTYRNAGTIDINATLLSEMRARTTHPPETLSEAIQSSTTLGPRASRDVDTPDLGYHYAPLDYVANTLVVTNAALTLTNGVAIGFYGNNGIWLQSGSSLVSGGTGTSRNHLTRYTCVQEASLNWGGGSVPNNLALTTYNSVGPYPTINLRFTDLETPAADGSHLITDAYTWRVSSLTLRDCKVQGGHLSLDTASGSTCEFANNVLASAGVSFSGQGVLTLYNNLFFQGYAAFGYAGGGTWLVQDNHFHLCGVDDWAGGISHSYNAYVGTTGYPGRLTPNGTGDVLISAFNFTSSTLGAYYQSSANLQNAGSQANASARGLYHYTTLASQAKEGASRLDIGFHYVSTDANGLPVDSDMNGMPDFAQDFNGNGVYDPTTETDWRMKVRITQPKTSSMLP